MASTETDVLDWAIALLPDGIKTTNLSSDWNDGTRLSMLVNSVQPGLIPDADGLNPEDALSNTRTALALAEQRLGIPQVIMF